MFCQLPRNLPQDPEPKRPHTRKPGAWGSTITGTRSTVGSHANQRLIKLLLIFTSSVQFVHFHFSTCIFTHLALLFAASSLPCLLACLCCAETQFVQRGIRPGLAHSSCPAVTGSCTTLWRSDCLGISLFGSWTTPGVAAVLHKESRVRKFAILQQTLVTSRSQYFVVWCGLPYVIELVSYSFWAFSQEY